jgi:UDP-glucose 4-epimerase
VSQVVLLTGVSQFVGSRLAGQLAADPDVERIIGVDTVPPAKDDLARIGRTEFVRADIRNPLIARIIAQAKVDTVVHASVTATPRGGGRTPVKEMNVIGTMQLLAACQKSETVRRLVVKSTTIVYGSSPRDPAVFDETMAARSVPRAGFAKDAMEVESYVRGFSRRRPDIAVSILRFANFIGPTVETPLSRYLSMPAVPTAFGYDPRLQLVHETDALEVLRLAAMSDRPGVFNVAGPGSLLLSQAIRRAGRIQLPVPGPAVEWVGRLVRRGGLVDFSPSQMQFRNFGRAVDISKLESEFSYVPRYSTSQAFASFLAERPLAPVISERRIEIAERAIGHVLHLDRAQAVFHG